MTPPRPPKKTFLSWPLVRLALVCMLPALALTIYLLYLALH